MYTEQQKLKLLNRQTNEYEAVTVNRNTSGSIASFITHYVKEGENVFVLAQKYYGDYKLFYVILDHNLDITLFTDIVEGEPILIPKHEKLNATYV